LADVTKANLLAWYGKTKPNNKSTHSPIKRINTKKLKPGLVASYDIQHGNGQGLFWFWHFINLSLIYLYDTYPLTYSPGTHMGPTF